MTTETTHEGIVDLIVKYINAQRRADALERANNACRLLQYSLTPHDPERTVIRLDDALRLADGMPKTRVLVEELIDLRGDDPQRSFELIERIADKVKRAEAIARRTADEAYAAWGEAADAVPCQ